MKTLLSKQGLFCCLPRKIWCLPTIVFITFIHLHFWLIIKIENKMKKQALLVFGILVATMSSCVYSLFPIYTEDTLIFKEQLVGKWNIGEDGSYMLFEKMGSDDEASAKEENYKYELEIKEGFTMRSNDPLFIEKNGRKIYDEDSIKIIMRENLGNISLEEDKRAKTPPIDFEKIIKEQIKEDKLTPQDIAYEGSVAVYEEKSYRLTVMNSKGEKEVYVAHLVEIGKDLFMDLYPIKEFDSKDISDNFFPVHTFYKVAVSDKEFTMTHFDLDKLNKLFDSNLIRLRHENVDGTILITAQPKELQKFIDKYADDESVFDFTETYQKASL